MKLIEAMKRIKDLQRKCDDLKEKVFNHAAISSVETPVYPEQQKVIDGWLQAHSDIVKEILRLRIAIQKTNLVTDVTIELGGKGVTKTIAEWIHRRRELAEKERVIWASLSDRGIQEGMATAPSGEQMQIKLVRFYEPAKRDRMIDLYGSEPSLIDAKLEVVNAVTDLIE